MNSFVCCERETRKKYERSGRMATETKDEHSVTQLVCPRRGQPAFMIGRHGTRYHAMCTQDRPNSMLHSTTSTHTHTHTHDQQRLCMHANVMIVMVMTMTMMMVMTMMMITTMMMNTPRNTLRPHCSVQQVWQGAQRQEIRCQACVLASNALRRTRCS